MSNKPTGKQGILLIIIGIIPLCVLFCPGGVLHLWAYADADTAKLVDNLGKDGNHWRFPHLIGLHGFEGSEGAGLVDLLIDLRCMVGFNIHQNIVRHPLLLIANTIKETRTWGVSTMCRDLCLFINRSLSSSEITSFDTRIGVEVVFKWMLITCGLAELC